MSWAEVDGAGWSWVEMDGAGQSWVHGLVIPNKFSGDNNYKKNAFITDASLEMLLYELKTLHQVHSESFSE